MATDAERADFAKRGTGAIQPIKAFPRLAERVRAGKVIGLAEAQEYDRETDEWRKSLVFPERVTTTTSTVTIQGTPGLKGDKGGPGIRGLQGLQGIQGPAGSFTTLIADVVYLLNADTGKYIPLTLTGPIGAEQVNYGTPIDLYKGNAVLADTIYLKDSDTGLYSPVTMEGVNGAEQMNFGAQVAVTPAVLILADVIYLKNSVTGKYVPIRMIGPEGAEQMSFDGTQIP